MHAAKLPSSTQQLCLAAACTLPAPALSLLFRVRQALSVLEAGTKDPPSGKPAQQEPTPKQVLHSTGAAGSELKILGELAVSVAERFVPPLAAVALGRTVAPQPLPGVLAVPTAHEDAPSPTFGTSGPAAGDDGAPGGGGGRANGVAGNPGNTALATPLTKRESPATLAGVAAAATARPTTLACFAAECALALTSLLALVASSSPSVAAPAAAAQRTGGGSENAGGGGVRAPLVEIGSSTEGREASRDAPGDCSQHSREHLSQEAADRSAGEVLPVANEGVLQGNCGVKEEKEEEGEKDEPTWQRALAVLAVLFPVSTLPLLVVAEAWLGGGADGAAAAAAAAAAAGRYEGAGHRSYQELSRIPASWDEGGGPGGGAYVYGFSGRLGGARDAALSGQEGGTGGRGLAVLAVRDLTAVVVSGMEASRRSQERHEQRRRALERDGVDGETRILQRHLLEIDPVSRVRVWSLDTLLLPLVTSGVGARGGVARRLECGTSVVGIAGCFSPV